MDCNFGFSLGKKMNVLFCQCFTGLYTVLTTPHFSGDRRTAICFDSIILDNKIGYNQTVV